MSIKKTLITFEFESIRGLKYDPELDVDFMRTDLVRGQGVQPVIEKAFKRIKECMAKSVSTMFLYGKDSLDNIDNFLHVGQTVITEEVQHKCNTYAQSCTLLYVKFYRLEPDTTFKVAIDIEEMPSSALNNLDDDLYIYTVRNDKIQKMVGYLDQKFHLNGRIEYTPMFKRGRLDKPHFLVTSDGRMIEYDFDKVLFDEQSEYQNVKIISSPSLGNTLLLDNLQNFAEVDLNYTHALMDHGKVDYKDKEILILGGGDGALLWELLKEEPKFVTVAEIDPVVIKACRLHLKPCGQVFERLEDTNYKIIIDDCVKVLRNSYNEGHKYDVIFNDLTDIPVAKREESRRAFDASLKQGDNPWAFIESIFNLSLDCLKDDGLYMTHTTGKGNLKSIKAWEDFLKESLIKVDYTTRDAYVPSFMEIWMFYTITKEKLE